MSDNKKALAVLGLFLLAGAVDSILLVFSL